MQALRRLKKENSELKASLDYMVRLCLRPNQQANKQNPETIARRKQLCTVYRKLTALLRMHIN
jgi:hypothetical protein